MEQTNEYSLTADELGMVQPMIESMENLQKEVQAILRAITRLRGLEGNYNLVGNKLVRAAAAPQLTPIARPQPTAEPELMPNGNG